LLVLRLEAVPASIRRAVTPLLARVGQPGAAVELAWCSAIYPSYKTHAVDQYGPFQFKSVSAQAWTVGDNGKVNNDAFSEVRYYIRLNLFVFLIRGR
jgi:hypothetical protein